MSDDLVIEGTAPGPAAPRPKPPRSPILFVVVNGFAFIAGVLSVVGLTAAFSRIGLWFAFVPALLIGGVLPVFLVVRAARALKRRSLPVVLRHVINLILYVVIHAAIAGVVLDWFDRSRPDYASAAHALVTTPFGDVPWISGILKKSSEGARIVFGEKTRPAEGEPEGPAGDAGPTPAGDGGPAPIVDAGPTPTPAGTTLSDRTDGGRVVRRAVYVVETSKGDPGLLVVTVQAGGGHKQELLSLASHADSGSPTAASVASDGSVAVVLGGARVLLRGPGERLGLVRALNRNGMLKLGDTTGQVRRVADVVVGPKGSAVAVVEVFVTLEGGVGEVRQVLVGIQAGEVKRLRMSGAPLPDNADDLIDGFLLRRPTASGAFCVAESFRQGGAAVAVDTSGEKFQVNPERLLCGHLDNPGALAEVSRTDTASGGVPDRSVQRFYGAFSLQDGRALTQANFVEKGRDTWIFLADPRAGTRALGAWSKDGAPWAAKATELDAEPEGGFAWVDGPALVVGTVKRPADARRVPALKALKRNNTPVGAASRLRAPRIARGGDFVLVLADVAPPGARTRPAVLVASEADLASGLAEEIIAVGDEISGVKLKEISAPPSRVTRR
jgi:hypothetical protein